MNSTNPFQIASPSKDRGFDLGESQRVVTVEPASKLGHWQVKLNGRPVGIACNEPSALALARTLDPNFTRARPEDTELPLHTLTGGKPWAANSVVRSHTRDAHGRMEDFEKQMHFHDSARIRTKNPDEFRAHTASLNAFSATDKAAENPTEAWHLAAGEAHQMAAEFHEALGDTATAQRHTRGADFHARKVRSAGGHAANSVAMGNCENWIA